MKSLSAVFSYSVARDLYEEDSRLRVAKLVAHLGNGEVLTVQSTYLVGITGGPPMTVIERDLGRQMGDRIMQELT